MNIFLSYAATDKKLAQELADKLQANGLNTRLSLEELGVLGENWAEQYGKALASSDALIVILSRESSTHSSMHGDISFALGNKRFKDRLVTVYLSPPEEMDSSNLPWALKKGKVLNLYRHNDRDEAFKQVVQWLKHEESKETA